MGGAAKASNKIHNSLVNSGIDSNMFVAKKISNDPKVFVDNSFLYQSKLFLRQKISSLLIKSFSNDKKNQKSLSIFPSGNLKKMNELHPDIVQLHWINGEFLSIKDISKINYPIIWTMHDMWPMCGLEHYTTSDTYSKKKYDEIKKLKFVFNLNRYAWKKKIKFWKKKFIITTPSKWLLNQIKGSYLFQDFEGYHIPYPIDTNIWKRKDKLLCKKKLNLDIKKKLILFGAIGGTRDYRKGFDFFEKYIESNDHSANQIAVFGQEKPKSSFKFKDKIKWLGNINNENHLCDVYNAADLMIVPSRIDNSPQTAMEAQSCGIPVVAFNISGLPEMVEHNYSGFLCRPYDTDNFITTIQKLINSDTILNKFSDNALKRSVNLWGSSIIAKQYINLYQKTLSNIK